MPLPCFAAPPPLARSAFRSTFSRPRRRRGLPHHPPPSSRLPTRLTQRGHVTPRRPHAAVALHDAFLQCVQCLAVYHVEPEEIEGVPRVVVCSACLHEWYASDDDLIWGDKQLNAALALAAERGDGINAFTAARGVEKQEKKAVDDGPMNVFVGNLSFRATKEDLYRAFSGYGAVLKCEMPVDSTGLPKGFAFVEMESRESAMKAIECLQGTSIVGRDISLSEAKPKPPSARRAFGKPKINRKAKPLKDRASEQSA